MTEIENIVKRIDAIKYEILHLGNLRPGSVTKQYGDPKNKKQPFHQINYTFKGKFKTDYVKKTFVGEMEKQTLEYKKFKELIAEWMELGIKISKMMMKENVK